MDGNSGLIQDRYGAEEYFKKSKADVCVFLNQYNIGKPIINLNHDLVHIEPSLYWSVEFKNDNLSYLYHQTDTLNFFKSEFPDLFETRLKIKPFINQASEDLSLLFGARLIPTWQNVERMYYRSKNPEIFSSAAVNRPDRGLHRRWTRWRCRSGGLGGGAAFALLIDLIQSGQHAAAVTIGKVMCFPRDLVAVVHVGLDRFERTITGHDGRLDENHGRCG